MKRRTLCLLAAAALLCGCGRTRVSVADLGSPLQPPLPVQVLDQDPTPVVSTDGEGRLCSVEYQLFYDARRATAGLQDFVQLRDMLSAKLYPVQPALPESLADFPAEAVVLRGHNGWNSVDLAGALSRDRTGAPSMFVVTVRYGGDVAFVRAEPGAPLGSAASVPKNRAYITLPPTSWGMDEETVHLSLGDAAKSWHSDRQPSVTMMTGDVTAFGQSMQARLGLDRIHGVPRLARAAVWASFAQNQGVQAATAVKKLYQTLQDTYGTPNRAGGAVEYDFANWNDGSNLPERGLGQQVAQWFSPDGVTSLTLSYHTPDTSASTGLPGGGYQIVLVFAYNGLSP